MADHDFCWHCHRMLSPEVSDAHAREHLLAGGRLLLGRRLPEGILLEILAFARDIKWGRPLRRSLVFKCPLEPLERVYSIRHLVAWPINYPISRREWDEHREALNANVPASSGLRLTKSAAFNSRMIAFSSGEAWPKPDWRGSQTAPHSLPLPDDGCASGRLWATSDQHQ